MKSFLSFFTLFLFIVTINPAYSEGDILNIYSSRHYSTDEKLYSNFTKETGIVINRVDGKGDALIARLKQEGKLSPADLFITVDAGRLWRAENAGLFQAVDSQILREKIPERLRHADGYWFGISSRARVLIHNKDKIVGDNIKSYMDLMKPEFKGKICVRSSGNIYNQSLLASFIEQTSYETAKSWAKAVLSNLARKPQGGDTDQIKAVAAGVCDVALVNSYYFYRLKRSEKKSDQNIVKNLGIVFPDQKGSGTHINISGAGVLKTAKNKDAAVKFLEYLTTDGAQRYFSDGNNEYPVVRNVNVNKVVDQHKDFKIQNMNVRKFGENQKKAKMIFDEIAFP